MLGKCYLLAEVIRKVPICEVPLPGIDLCIHQIGESFNAAIFLFFMVGRRRKHDSFFFLREGCLEEKEEEDQTGFLHRKTGIDKRSYATTSYFSSSSSVRGGMAAHKNFLKQSFIRCIARQVSSSRWWARKLIIVVGASFCMTAVDWFLLRSGRTDAFLDVAVSSWLA